VLTLSSLAELAIDHQIRDARTQRGPVPERQIETLCASAIAVRSGPIEAGGRDQDPGGDERRQHGSPGEGGRPRPWNGAERQQPLVRGGFDDLMTIEPEGDSGNAPEPQRDGHDQAGCLPAASEQDPSMALHGSLKVRGTRPLATPAGASNVG
jgi:hypothetical protein